MASRSMDFKRKIIIDYIKNKPIATYKDIRRDTKIHPERFFNGLEEAYKEAGIKLPRTFKRKSKEEKKKIIIDYIKKNSKAGGNTIARNTKINVLSIFKSVKEAFETANVIYPRTLKNKSKEQRKKEIIELIRTNPLITIKEIMKKLKISPYKVFTSTEEMYQSAGINYLSSSKKRNLKIKQRIIDFIKENPLATQREINKACKTKVQTIWKGGIFEAFKEAKVSYPFERLKLYGTALKEIKKRAGDFEEKIAIKLSGYGNVNRLVKTKRGVADIILERKDKRIIVEIKDYLCKDISISQINQLNKYLEDLNCNIGLLICHKKPKKDKFLIDKNKILILEDKELFKIPILTDT